MYRRLLMAGPILSFYCAAAQSPFSFTTPLIQMPSADAFIQQVQANDFTPCIPSAVHELLWALGRVISNQRILISTEKGTVI